jgi:YbbR domain-containing protein
MRDFFLKDLGWKLLSLFLAIGIWLTVHNILTEEVAPAKPDTQRTNIYSNQPVRIVSMKSDVHLYRVAPDEVTVILTGPANLMSDLQSSQIRAEVDLSNTNESQRDWWRPVQVSPPPGITLIEVQPARVNVIPPPGP